MKNGKRPPPGTRAFNKLAVRVAGTRFAPTWAVIEHRGRRSGKPYRTPVEIVAATNEALYVALAWGPNTDWMRNMRAANGGTVRWKGRSTTVSGPVVVDRDEVFALAGPVSRFALSRMKMEEFVKFPRAQGNASS